jgi:hypothetical protein
MLTYAVELRNREQMRLIESQTSDIDGTTDLVVYLFLNAGSLIPYVGPLVQTLGAGCLEQMKNLIDTSTTEDTQAAGISVKVWVRFRGSEGEVRSEAG